MSKKNQSSSKSSKKGHPGNNGGKQPLGRGAPMSRRPPRQPGR